MLFSLTVDERDKSVYVELYGKETDIYLDPITVEDSSLAFTGFEESPQDISNLIDQAIDIIEARFAGWSGDNGGPTTVDDLSEIVSWSYF